MVWKTFKIGDVCDLFTGGTPSKSKKEYFENGEIKWLVSGDIHKKEILDCEGRITQLGFDNSSTKFLPKNSVMIALNGQGKTRGTVAILRIEATCNQSLVCIVPKDRDQLLPEYLHLNLHGRYEEIRRITGDDGKDRRGLNMPLIRNIELPIPPLAEQKKIVAVLDEAFNNIDQARQLVERNLKNAHDLYDSTLNQIFSKRGYGWQSEKFGKVCEFVRGPFGGSLKKNIFKSDGYAVYEQQHAINNQFSNIRYFIDENKFKEMSRFELFPGDLIMSCSGTMGKIAIVPESIKSGIINQALLKLTPSKKINRYFLKFWMQSNDFQNKIEELAQGAAIQNMASVKILKMIDVPIIPHNAQAEIVNRLDIFWNDCNELENIYQQKISALDELKQSLLQKAFRGELTQEKAAA
jgi:type I restriction enzyme S subunit